MDVFALTEIFLVGTAVVVPVIYLISSLFHSIFWGTIIVIPFVLVAITRIRFKKIRVDLSSFLLVIFSLIFSTWLMFKTFHGGSQGQLYVGSNNVFDFGFAIGLIRSMSWGANVPIGEPFFAGFPILYHYFFVFWVAILEYFGLPIVWAMNIPSILSFTALLIIVYYLPQKLFKQNAFVGWITVLLTVTNSSLTFWKLLPKISTVWHLQTYPFVEPFDSSAISIFITLNNYVNQRHLAFSLALGFLLLLWTVGRRHNTAILGLLTGLMFLWNIPVSIATGILIGIVLVIQKEFKSLATFVVVTGLGFFASLAPLIGGLSQIVPFLQLGAAEAAKRISVLSTWSPLSFLIQNLGILPFALLLGLFAIPAKKKFPAALFTVFFAVVCMLAVIGHRGFDQKFYSYFIIGINAVAASAVGWVWRKTRVLALILLFVLTISGFVDLIPIKNEFAFPLVGPENLQVISWIASSTPKNAVFVSYEDMIDPVVLAGRMNYYGFFKNIGQYDRSPDLRKIYAGDTKLAKERGISYILVPKRQKNDFPYSTDLQILRKVYITAYEDKNILIVKAQGT